MPGGSNGWSQLHKGFRKGKSPPKVSIAPRSCSCPLNRRTKKLRKDDRIISPLSSDRPRRLCPSSNPLHLLFPSICSTAVIFLATLDLVKWT
ncbi:hypothetical protein MRB53_026685 [Persea americana]|uniref:Uncharacterized protein n=1 Tax=Persea americana TaxID=3435 RepID=A0ACC2LIV1_PERAE|nr:hypothetical protein MRB53_026685 [Persea americana]